MSESPIGLRVVFEAIPEKQKEIGNLLINTNTVSPFLKGKIKEVGSGVTGELYSKVKPGATFHYQKKSGHKMYPENDLLYIINAEEIWWVD